MNRHPLRLLAALALVLVPLSSCSAPPRSADQYEETTRVATPPDPPHSSPPAPAPVLPYQADWSADEDGWIGSDDWTTVNGTLVSRGTDRGNEAGISAPLNLDGIDAYAVEAEIQANRNSDGGALSGLASYGVVVRIQDDGTGYGIGSCQSAGIYICAPDQPAPKIVGIWSDDGDTALDIRPFSGSDDWHLYRIEVRDNTLTVYIDGSFALSATDNAYLTGDVGLWSNRVQINVRRFAVTAL